jgi:Flp pilus assembly protein TadG
VTGSDGERGAVSVMMTIVAGGLLVFSLTLITAGQQWQTRRAAIEIAEAAARAGAQGTQQRRIAGRVDPREATQRAQRIIRAHGASGSVTVVGDVVTVAVAVSFDPMFPVPGVDSVVDAVSSATAIRSVNG